VSPVLFPDDSEVDDLIVGPESVAWQRTSDMRLNLVMLYPLLLQVAHPTVGAGVRDFSDFEDRPWNRLLRTLDYVSVLVYGGREAVTAGRTLRGLHRRFKGIRPDGKPYSALEPDAYAWVHATLIDAYVAGHAQFGHPMNPAETERFYSEYRGLGRLIGVRKRDLPPDWTSFRIYFDRMVSAQLVPNESVDRVLRGLHAAPTPIPMPDLLWRAIRLTPRRALWLAGVGLLDRQLRRRLGIAWSPFDEAQFRTLGLISRSVDPLMPDRLKITGPAQMRRREKLLARRRAAGQEVALEPVTHGVVA
jgi:uncharacterized protein (DUF2236 family)